MWYRYSKRKMAELFANSGDSGLPFTFLGSPDLNGLTMSIALDKALFFQSKSFYIFLILGKNVCCGYSLEASNEYPQYMFSLRNKKLLTWYPLLSRTMTVHSKPTQKRNTTLQNGRTNENQYTDLVFISFIYQQLVYIWIVYSSV